MENVIVGLLFLVVLIVFILGIASNMVRWSDEERPHWERARAKRKAWREQKRREREQQDE